MLLLVALEKLCCWLSVAAKSRTGGVSVRTDQGKPCCEESSLEGSRKIPVCFWFLLISFFLFLLFFFLSFFETILNTCLLFMFFSCFEGLGKMFSDSHVL